MEKLTAGKYKLICFTDDGKKLMLTLGDKLIRSDGKEADIMTALEEVFSLSDFTREEFRQGNVLIYIGAVAIAVRAIAPYIKDKTTDPAVLSIDEKGTFVIPVLSGHIGGANSYAVEIAQLIGAIPVVTTATDLRGEFAVDVFARNHDLTINDMKLAKEFSAKLLKGEEAVFTVTPKLQKSDGLYLIPRCLVVGMGCRKGKSLRELRAFLMEELEKNALDKRALKALLSIDLKSEEPGLVELAKELEIPFITYSAVKLMEQEGEFESSEMVLEKTGADNVCERALAAYGAEKILVHKTARDGMTLAIGIYLGKENDEK